MEEEKSTLESVVVEEEKSTLESVVVEEEKEGNLNPIHYADHHKHITLTQNATQHIHVYPKAVER